MCNYTTYDLPGLRYDTETTTENSATKYCQLFNLIFLLCNFTILISLSLISLYFLTVRPTYQYSIRRSNGQHVSSRTLGHYNVSSLGSNPNV